MALAFPDIDPVALGLGPLKIRWYALAYLAGFIGGWIYAMKLVDLDPQRRPSRLDIDNILPWLVLGVIVGGRIGYVLFYNLGYYLQHPLEIFFVWEGGMSFHGGLLGVATVCICYARHHRFSILALGDIIATVAPIGLFFGRIANFINGELFGRESSVPWAMVFPYGGDMPRHPSQLYEAGLEGIALFAILFLMARQKKIRQKQGTLFGTLLAGYGVSRFIVEYFREPDIQLGLFFNIISMGQILCLPMILFGAGLIAYVWKKA